MGRPKKEDGKQKRICIRIDEDTYEQLWYVSSITGLSESEILRQGVQIQYRSLRTPRH